MTATSASSCPASRSSRRCRSGSAAIVTGLQFARSMSWGAGFRFARPVRWVCAKLDDRHDRGGARGRGDRRVLVRSPFDASGPRRDPPRGRVPLRAPRRGSRARSGRPLRAHHLRPGRARCMERSGGQARRGRVSGRAGARAGGLVRRALPPPAGTRRDRRRCSRTSGTSRSAATGSPSSRTAATRTWSVPGTSSCCEGGSRTPSSPTAATSRSGSTLSSSGRTRSRSSGAPGRSPTRPRASSSSCRSSAGDDVAVQAARLAKGDQASELVREFPELEGHIGATYARLAGYPADVARGDRRPLPAGRSRQPAARDPGGPGARSRRQARHAHRRLRGRHPADRLARPVRAAPCRDRPVPARRRGGRRRSRGSCCRATSRDFVEERLEGLLDVPVHFVRAARASTVSDLAGVARQATVLADAERTPEFDAVQTAFDRANRLAGRAEADAAPRVDSALLEEGAERELAHALAATTIEPEAILGGGGARAPRRPLLRRRPRDGRRPRRQGEPAAAAPRRSGCAGAAR